MEIISSKYMKKKRATNINLFLYLLQEKDTTNIPI